MRDVKSALVDRVLARLGLERVRTDFDGLSRLYHAWCEAIPFDNIQKLIGLAEGRPLPGATASAFFEDWLASNTGGTCWAGNGALHDLLQTLGFRTERVAATMLSAPDTPPSNHGSVLVHLDGERFITDASILSDVPLRLAPSTGLPRVELHGDTFIVIWRTPRAPAGFPCRIDRIGLGAADFEDFHQRTAAWSPFNYALTARRNFDRSPVAFAAGKRFAFLPNDDIAITERPREQFLIDELHISPTLVARIPPDRETPPRPPSA